MWSCQNGDFMDEANWIIIRMFFMESYVYWYTYMYIQHVSYKIAQYRMDTLEEDNST